MERSRGEPPAKSGPFARLEARPLHLPRLPAGYRRQPFRAFIHIGGLGDLTGPFNFGKVHDPHQTVRLKHGPVYARVESGCPGIMSLFPARHSGVRGAWRGTQTLWATRPGYHGPILVRGGQLDGPDRLGFGTGVRPRRQLRLPAGSWSATRSAHIDARRPGPGWRIADAETRIRVPGLYAFQVDGRGFSYRLAFSALFTHY